MARIDKPKSYSNSLFSVVYALGALRNYPIRNAGIALVLAIGVSLPTTVFVWTASGTSLVVDQYFDSSNYQLTLSPRTSDSADYLSVFEAKEVALQNPYIDQAHHIPTSIGILKGGNITPWETYSMTALNYLFGIKDFRVLLVDNHILEYWSSEFSWEGNFTLSPGQVLAGPKFLEYTYDVHNLNLTLGDEISMDFLPIGGRAGAATPETLGNITIANMTIAGLFEPSPVLTSVIRAYPSISRHNWDPLGPAEPVLGIWDSVIMLASDIGEAVVETTLERGYFQSPVLLTPDRANLIAGGAQYIDENLEEVKIHLEEEFQRIIVTGLYEVEKLRNHVNTYMSSQILTLLAFPVLIMSMMLTIFTSETSISRRKREITTLRSKGASFNQVFSTFVWEALILAIIGLALGLSFAMIMAPLIGSTTSLFSFDFSIYVSYIEYLTLPPLALIIAGAIAMYLPAAYILHVARRIDVSEVGQPTTNIEEEGTEETSGWRYAFALGATLSVMVVMPLVFEPIGSTAIIQVLVVTLLLFVASYLGSRTMRAVTAHVSEGTNFLFGEKSVYLSRSLRKRKGQFLPLMVILTLTLTTTSMMLIQSASFEATLTNELSYAIGADLRIETDPLPFTYIEELLSNPGVYKATPVLETWGRVGDDEFFIEGLNALDYLKIGYFAPESFPYNTSSDILTKLNATSNGIIISEYYANLWNKSTGQTLQISTGTINASRTAEYQIIGVMKSAPGFGAASTRDIQTSTFGSQFGFQVKKGGFALTNLDYLSNVSTIQTSQLFLVDLISGFDSSELIMSIDAVRNTDVYSPESFALDEFSGIQLFVSGIDGLTMVGFVMSAAMGLAAITLFLGSAVLEREPEYALVRALGGTRKQVVSMVFGEFAGVVIAAIGISIILGVLFGFVMGILTFSISPFSPIITEVLAIPLTLMIVIIITESIVMIASCYIPALRASRVDPAHVLRNL